MKANRSMMHLGWSAHRTQLHRKGGCFLCADNAWGAKSDPQLHTVAYDVYLSCNREQNSLLLGVAHAPGCTREPDNYHVRRIIGVGAADAQAQLAIGARC